MIDEGTYGMLIGACRKLSLTTLTGPEQGRLAADDLMQGGDGLPRCVGVALEDGFLVQPLHLIQTYDLVDAFLPVPPLRQMKLRQSIQHFHQCQAVKEVQLPSHVHGCHKLAE